MAHKHIKVNIDFSQTPPVWTFTGDVDPGNCQVVTVPANTKINIKWTLKAKPGAGNTCVFSQVDATGNGVPGIEFIGGAEDPWASGTAPTLVYEDGDTSARIKDDNETQHNDLLHHYYRVNVMWNGTLISQDPEVDEQGGGTL
jgi:hypothetical protein